MINQIQTSLKVVAITIFALAATSYAQDYDGEAETAITGLSGLSGLSGFGGLSALANGVVTGYAPMNGNGGDESETIVQNGGQDGQRGLGASESSDSDSSSDYDDDSNDSSASEDHPILSKFFNLISGSRSKRSVDQAEAPIQQQATVQHNHRVKRGYKGWVPYVSTYVKTDKKANFKWGVKAKVGKKYGK